MTTAIPKSALRYLLSGLGNLPLSSVLWAGEPVPFLGPKSGRVQGFLTLDSLTRVAIGWDEEKREYIPDPNNLPSGLLLRRTISGNRVLTISMKAENYGPEEGYNLLEKIRTLLSLASSREQLNLSGVSLSSVGDIRSLGGRVDNREISVAQMDLFLNQFVSLTVTQLGDTYIENVTVDERLED